MCYVPEMSLEEIIENVNVAAGQKLIYSGELDVYGVPVLCTVYTSNGVHLLMGLPTSADPVDTTLAIATGYYLRELMQEQGGHNVFCRVAEICYEKITRTLPTGKKYDMVFLDGKLELIISNGFIKELSTLSTSSGGAYVYEE